jgi:hypothetical protein
VALTLATYADKENYCYPSIALLMEDTGLSNRCVIDCLRELEIQKVISADRSNGRHTYYTFTMDDYAGPVNVRTETSGMQSGSPVNVKQQPVNVKQQPVNMTTEDCREVHTNSQLTTKELPLTANKGKVKKESVWDISKIVLPVFIDHDSWSGFIEMRIAKKKPIQTERTANLILKDLTAWNLKGLDCNKALDNSTKNGWTDVYEPKDQFQAKGQNKGNVNAAFGSPQMQPPSQAEIDEIEALKAEHKRRYG